MTLSRFDDQRKKSRLTSTMEIHKLPPAPYKTIVISSLLLLTLILYSSRTSNDCSFDDRECLLIDCHLVDRSQSDEEEATVNLCQVHVHYLGSDSYDDQGVLAVLSKLKMFDFKIGQPTWGPGETLMYLCEHRLKSGAKRTKINQELSKTLKSMSIPLARVTWTCA